jgi:hypothetical protein
MIQVKSSQLDTWSITYTDTHLQIGCQNHTIDEWKQFTDEQISVMDDEALEWWSKWKDSIFQIIELSPAEPTKALKE